MQTILCTGISGSKRRDTLVNFVAEAVPASTEALVKDVGDAMFELESDINGLDSSHQARNIWEDTILKRNTSLAFHRNSAQEQILAKKNQAELKPTQDGTLFMISTHFVFHHNRSRVRSYNPQWVSEVNPDIFFTIIDDVASVWERLHNSGQQRWNQLSPINILDWREEEILHTQIMADSLGKKHYVIPRRRATTLMHDLLFHPQKSPIYLSYPMTFVKEYSEIHQSIRKLREFLRQWFTVFDPADMQDLERKDELFALTENCNLDNDDLCYHLQSQTVAIDHTIIDQCKAVIVYYPTIKIEHNESDEGLYIPPFSSGVLDEIFYATQRGKDVYLIWKSPKAPGPFLETLCTEQVNSQEELGRIFDNAASRAYQAGTLDKQIAPCVLENAICC